MPEIIPIQSKWIAMNQRQVGHPTPNQSNCTCTWCLYDSGVTYQAPGTPDERGCQNCLWDGTTNRCTGCWKFS